MKPLCGRDGLRVGGGGEKQRIDAKGLGDECDRARGGEKAKQGGGR